MAFQYTNLIAPPEFKNQWREDLKVDDYHADMTAVNSSSLKKMTKSAHAFHEDFFSLNKPEPTKAMKFGTLAHLALLQGSKFKDNYIVMPEFESRTADGKISESKNTKYYKQQVEDWKKDIPESAIIVTAQERESLFAMIDSVLSNELASKILSNGKPEIAGYWRDAETGILCRMQADFISFDLGVLLDVKTTVDCEMDIFKRQIEKLKYYFQMEMYSEGIKQITGLEPKEKAWLVIENTMPYEVRIYQPSPHYEEIGQYEFRQSMNQLKKCIESTHFPMGQKEGDLIEPNKWFLDKYKDVLINI